jgi:ribonuclease P protein subunit POP4
MLVIPKEHTIFRIEIPVTDNDTESEDAKSLSNLVFEIVGDQFIQRPAERATKKFKFHLPKDT